MLTNQPSAFEQNKKLLVFDLFETQLEGAEAATTAMWLGEVSHFEQLPISLPSRCCRPRSWSKGSGKH